jgi:hypothetical protein
LLSSFFQTSSAGFSAAAAGNRNVSATGPSLKTKEFDPIAGIAVSSSPLNWTP